MTDDLSTRLRESARVADRSGRGSNLLHEAADALDAQDARIAAARKDGIREAADMLLPGPTSRGGLWAKRLAERRAAILAAADKEESDG
jgi:hypothetical protein